MRYCVGLVNSFGNNLHHVGRIAVQVGRSELCPAGGSR